MRVDQFSDDDGTEFDAGDLGTAWLPYSEPRACDLEALAVALIQHAGTMATPRRTQEKPEWITQLLERK